MKTPPRFCHQCGAEFERVGLKVSIDLSHAMCLVCGTKFDDPITILAIETVKGTVFIPLLGIESYSVAAYQQTRAVA